MAEKKIQETTPIGEAMWAHVHKPRAFQSGGRDQGPPKYSIEVYFDPNDPKWKEWCAKVRAAAGKGTVPIKWEENEQDQRTGRLYASFKTGEKFKPALFDRYGLPLPEGTMIGNGSKVRVNYSPNAYDGFGGGVNLYLNAVQVLDLVEYTSRDAKGYGFDAEPAPVGAQTAAAGGPPPAEDDLPF
jgi:hypothetical protein